MSYRTLQEEGGLKKAMTLFSPDVNKPMGERNSTTIANFKVQPKSPSDWGNYDVCGGTNPQGIQKALVNAVLDEQNCLPDGKVHKWDDPEDAFNSALFPVVVRWTTGNRAIKKTTFNDEVQDTSESHAFPVVYRACWSKFKPVKGVHIPHEPRWETIKLHQLDSNGVAIDGDYRWSVFVDASLIGDIHCARSIVASLENSSIAANSYVYFFPDVTDEVRNNPQYPFKNPEDHKVSGASLGMAIFAAVQGWPSILYTGYTSFILPGYKVQNTSHYQQQNTNLKPTYLKGGPQSFTSNNVTTYGESYVAVGKQIDFVDSVQDLPYKMILAVFHKIPIIIPMTTALNTSTAQYIGAANQAWRTSLLNFYQLTYTMANSEAGVSAVIVDEGTKNKYARLLFMGKTIGEFMILAFLAANAQVVANMDAETDYAPRKKFVEDFQQVWTGRRVEQGQKMAQRAAALKAEKSSLKQAYDDGDIDKQQWITTTKENQAARLRQKKAKMAEKKTATKIASAKRSEVKEKIDAAFEAYKDNYHAAKAALGPKPTAKEKREFNQAWPSLATAKKRMNKESLKKVIGVELVKAREQTNPTLKYAQRYSTAEKLQKEVDSGPALASILNALYPADKIQPVQAAEGSSSADLVVSLKNQITSMVQGARNAAYRAPLNPDSAYMQQKVLENKRARRAAEAQGAVFDKEMEPNVLLSGPEITRPFAPASDKKNQNEDGEKPKSTATKLEPGTVIKANQMQNFTVTTDENSGEYEINGQPAKFNSDDNTWTITGTSKFRGFNNKTGPAYGGKTKIDSKGHFGAASKYRGPSVSSFTGAGRFQPRRIINRPPNDMDMDMTAWNPFTFLKDAAETVADGIEKGVGFVGRVAEKALPIAGTALKVASML